MTQSESRSENALVHQLLKLEADRDKVRRHYQAFEFQLMAANTLSELIDLLLFSAKEYFNLSGVSLWIVDRQYSIDDLIDSTMLLNYHNHLQIRHNHDFVTGLYDDTQHVILGDTSVLTGSRLFPAAHTPASVALIPLIRQQEYVGSLHFASDDPKRFEANKSKEVLEHFAQVAALCLENSINKEYLVRQSYRDLLTQVHNRLSLNEQLPKMVSQAVRTKKPLSCAFIDVDHFKKINDQYGHQAGDICLKSIAQTIANELRRADYIARFGGEEFVILLPECDTKAASVIAERARAAVASFGIETHKKQIINASISIGVSSTGTIDMGTGSDNELEQVSQILLNRSDQAMYRAKQNGRNCVIYSNTDG